MSDWNQTLLDQIRMAGLPTPELEFRAVKGRRWRWDYCWRSNGILLELQGGTWSKTRMGHSTGTGIRRDCEKSNAAVLAGWHPLSVTSDMVRDGSALKLIQEALERFPPF